MSTLEVLQIALARLENRRMKWDYGDWTRCTCGHIYAAANGKRAKDEEVVFTAEPEGSFKEALAAVAETLEGEFTPDHPDDLAEVVSDGTAVIYSQQNSEDRRDAAAGLLRETIKRLEAQYEQDRLDVLAQTKAVIDSAEVETEAEAEVVTV